MSTNAKSNPWASDKNFEPYDANVHAKELEEHDLFNRLTDDAIPVAGGLRTQLLQLVATSTDAQEVLAAEGIELPTVPKQFRLSQGEIGTIVADTKGLWTASIVVDGQTLAFQSEDRDSAMMACENFLERNRGPRELTASEALRVARLAQSRETAQAIELYVDLRLNGNDHRSAEDILADPSLTGILNDAARFVWAAGRQDYQGSDEFEALLDRVSATKPLNVNVIDALFDKYEDWKAVARSTRPTAPVAEPETERQPAPMPDKIQQGLESLSDEQINKLHLQTLQHRGHAIRRFDEKMRGN